MLKVVCEHEIGCVLHICGIRIGSMDARTSLIKMALIVHGDKIKAVPTNERSCYGQFEVNCHVKNVLICVLSFVSTV